MKRLPHPMSIEDARHDAQQGARYLVFESYDDHELVVSLGINGAIFRKAALVDLLRRVLEGLGEDPP